jgi:hypothetical protein
VPCAQNNIFLRGREAANGLAAERSESASQNSFLTPTSQNVAEPRVSSVAQFKTFETRGRGLECFGFFGAKVCCKTANGIAAAEKLWGMYFHIWGHRVPFDIRLGNHRVVEDSGPEVSWRAGVPLHWRRASSASRVLPGENTVIVSRTSRWRPDSPGQR